MQKSKLVQIQEEIPCTHFFIYKRKQYPINFDFFKCYSQYFSNNQLDFQFKKSIPLLNEEQEKSIDLSEESIQYFINFVHRQQIPLTDDNVISINYLAKIYQVPLLINVTQDYMSSNNNNLILQLLILYQNDNNFQLEQYEEIISKSLINYIDNERLLSLNISILYRIVDRYLVEKAESNENGENDKLMDFLFKCLKKFGRAASALFTHVDFTKENAKYMNQLLFSSDFDFDFHFMSCSLYKSFYQKQNEFLKKDEQIQRKQDELLKRFGDEFNKIKAEYERQLNEQEAKFNMEINNLKSEMVKIKSELTQQLNDQKNKYEDELDHLRSENEKLNSQVLVLFENKKKTDNEIIKIKEEMANIKIDQTQKINETIKVTPHIKILEYLNSLACGKNIIDSGLVGLEVSCATYGSIENLFDKSLDTVFKFKGNNEPGYILFDFKNKKVNISKYYLSVPSKKSNCWNDRPKSWKIKVSNDKQLWDLIDVKENEMSLNDFGWSNVFSCSKVLPNFYRFIKIEIITSQDNDNMFLLAEIEFIGSIADN